MTKRGRPVSRKPTPTAVAEKASARSAEAYPDLDRLMATLERLTTADLKRVSEHAQVLVEQKTEGERRSFIEEVTARAKDMGLSVADLFGKAVPASMRPSKQATEASGDRPKPGTVPVKFKGPGGETWSGRGMTPRWLTVLEAEGKKRADFAV
jgi:DNA-binding protein H-NS